MMDADELASARDNDIRQACDTLWQDVRERGYGVTRADALDVLGIVLESLDEYLTFELERDGIQEA